MRVLAFTLMVLVGVGGFATAQDKKDPPKGEEVAGKVLLNGQPVPAGTITFVSKDGKTAVSSLIGKDGTYAVVVPADEYVVVIGDPPPAKADPKDPPKKDEDKKPKPLIPEKYGDPKTSGLVYKVAKGKQNFDIDLKSR